MKMEIKVSPQTRQFAEAVEAMGGSVWVVGGAVRDTAAGRPFQDVDVMVADVTTKQMRAVASKVSGHSVPQVVETAHAPVFMVMFDGEPTEVAMAREEVSTGESKQDFAFKTVGVSVFADMKRREVTMNSMGVRVVTGEVFDPFDGMESVKSGVMVHTSDAFAESPERVFRVATQAARFKMTVAPETVEMMRQAGKGFHTVASHQRWMHFEKMAGKAVEPHRWVEAMEDCKWFEMFMPMVKVTQSMKDAMDAAVSKQGKVTSTMTDKQVKDAHTSEKASWMVAAMMEGMSDKEQKDFFKVMAFPKRVRSRAKEVFEFGGDRPVAFVQGRDFMDAGMKAGKEMGVAVKAAWKAQMAGEVFDKQSGQEFVKQWMVK